MIGNRELAQRIVDLLNEMTERDRCAVAAMVANRVPCNLQLADHPTVQVTEQHGGYAVGLLGILNGLAGVKADGRGWIEAVFDEPVCGEFSNLNGFRVGESVE